MAQRKNQGKVKFTKAIMMPVALEALVHVIEKGEPKYGPAIEKGWQDYEPSEVLDSLIRHCTALINGEEYDEIGTHHVCNIIFNAAALIEAQHKFISCATLCGDSSWLLKPEDYDENSSRLSLKESCDQHVSRLRDEHDLAESLMP